MLERRNHPRGRTFIGGKIDYNNSFCVVDCLVKDMPETGARLTFADTAIIPEEFDLRLRQKGKTKRVKLAWRHHDKVGVSFLEDRPPAEIISLNIARRLKEAETDRDRLKRRIDDIMSRYEID
ncbi:PilZ domain-containing protein [Methylobacterium aerolatum]|uniref:PilZ domain-containing protein n=1 Tax=Methylobacterium aerolatum TaxID=418708 RepID=A0ABU0I1A1_9HYPH|nr:PilZ domain-containing protein [Methylobacterium aerolatum]MDQ0448371.1 hypothetical protein [Methylobacterium aerolatum]